MPSSSSDSPRPGRCFLVGAGPGDPGLMTLRGKETIQLADVIVYDYLVNPEFLAWARKGAEFIYAGKKAGHHTLTQDEINDLIVKLAKEGKTVCRLKGGDPVLFGRGAEEAAMLRQAGIAFEIVPGISSALAAPIYAGIPVTHRAHAAQVTIFTGHEDPSKIESSLDWEKLAKADGTKVMLMGVERIDPITKELIAHGADPATPVALVRWGTTNRQQSLTGTLADIAEKVRETGFKAPAVAVIGSVASLREELSWWEKRPLFGKRVVVTRTREQAGELTKQLRDLGADAFELPTIRLEPAPDKRGFYDMVAHAHTYDWLVFTSPNGADAFFNAFFEIYEDARSIGGVRIAAIGTGTAKRIRARHLTVDLLPERFVAEGLIEAFSAISLDNLTVLWVKAEDTRDVISHELTKRGAIVDEAIAYRTVPETTDIAGGQKRLQEEGADIITFTSASTVNSFMQLGIPLAPGTKIASIGPVTSETCRKHGLTVDIEAETHNIAGLVKAVHDFFIKS